MLKAIYALSKLYTQKHLRKQMHIFAIILFFVMLGLPAFVNTFAFGATGTELVAIDFGLTIISYYAIITSIALGSSSLPSDLENKNAHAILARPIPRIAYLASHFFAIAFLMLVILTSLAMGLMLSVKLLTGTLDLRIIITTIMYWAESQVICAIALAASTALSTPLSACIAAFFYIVGGLSETFIAFFLVEDRGNFFLANFVRIIKSMIPDLTLFRIKDAAVVSLAIQDSYLIMVLVYGFLWCLAILLIGNLFFQRKDL